MEIGFVGLGKMGMNMVERLRRDNHQVVAFDLDDAKRKEVSTFGADGVNSLKDLVARLAPPRGVWVMVPAGEPTESTVNQLAELLEPGDTIIDGGNTNFHDDVRRAAVLPERSCTSRCRHQRRHLGAQARLLPDGRRRQGRLSDARARSSRRWRRPDG